MRSAVVAREMDAVVSAAWDRVALFVGLSERRPDALKHGVAPAYSASGNVSGVERKWAGRRVPLA
jgi:hypothetical protein